MYQPLSSAHALLRWLVAFAAFLVLLVLEAWQGHFTEAPPAGILVMLSFASAITSTTGLIFTNRKIHATYAIGLMAYLTLASEGRWSLLIITIALGCWLGAMVIHGYQRGQVSTRRPPLRIVVRDAASMTGQVVLALTSGILLYEALGGRVPLDNLTSADIGPLLALFGTTLGVYLGLVRLTSTLKASHPTVRQVLRTFWISLVGVLLFPIPFAIGAAYSYHNISTFAFVVELGLLIGMLSAIYVYNRALYRSEQQVRELTRLTRFSNAIRTSLDLETLLQTIYLQVSQLLDIDNFTMVLQDQASLQLDYLMTVQNGRVVPLPRDMHIDTLLKEVIDEQKPLLISDNFGQVVEGVLDTRIYSWLAVPVAASERTRGAMVVYTKSPDQRLTNDDRRRLSIIAVQIGVAVDNALLYEQSRTRAQQLRDLNAVSTELSSSLSTTGVLDNIAFAAKKVLNADGAAVFMWTDPAKRNLMLEQVVSMSDGFAMMPTLPLLAETPNQELLIVQDAQHDERITDNWGLLTNEGKRAWVETLLVNGEDRTGILVVYYNQPLVLPQQDIEILQTFTSQAALAISNAQLYSAKDADLSRRVDQLFQLQRLSQALFLSTMRLEEMYKMVLQRATDGTHADTGVLFLSRDESPYCVADVGYSSREAAENALSNLMNEVFRTGDMVLVEDTTQDNRFLGRHDIRSQMAIPILYDIQVIGAILLESRHPNAFGPEDMFFVMQVGTQARIAIDNVKLIQNIATTRDRLQAILNSMGEAIVLVSHNGQVVLANPAVQRLLQLEPLQIMNRSVTHLIDTRPNFAAAIGFDNEELRDHIHAMQTGRWKPQHQRHAYDFMWDGARRRFINRVDIPVEGTEEEGGWMMFFIDVTEERELAQAREDLANMIIHDLRGPLTAINMSMKLMESLARRDSTASSLANNVVKTTETTQRAVTKMLNLVSSLLDIGKMENGTIELNRQPFDMRAIATHVLEELSPIAQELEVQLENTIDPDLPTVLIDHEKIERALINLVDNALKFTPAEGYVSIDASLIQEQNAAFVKIMVKDTGPGVPDEYKETLFDRYVQVSGQKGARSGTGLGLTFCKMVVEAHGGRIWVTDNVVRGTIFQFTLPISN